MGWRPGTVALVASVVTLACTPPLTGLRPTPTAAASPTAAPLVTPTPEAISGPQVPLADVIEGVWCTASFESMVGTTMQCLSLRADATFQLGVVVNTNVNPPSVRTGTYDATDVGVTLHPRDGTPEVMRYTGNAGRPRLIDGSGRFTFEPYGRNP